MEEMQRKQFKVRVPQSNTSRKLFQWKYQTLELSTSSRILSLYYEPLYPTPHKGGVITSLGEGEPPSGGPVIYHSEAPLAAIETLPFGPPVTSAKCTGEYALLGVQVLIYDKKTFNKQL